MNKATERSKTTNESANALAGTALILADEVEPGGATTALARAILYLVAAVVKLSASAGMPDPAALHKAIDMTWASLHVPGQLDVAKNNSPGGSA